MHLRHQRAGGVDRAQLALLGLGVDRRRDSMCGEHHDRALGHLFGLLDEDRALGFEVGNDVLVVHDLLAHVDRCAMHLERLLDAVDGSLDAGAVPTWLGEQHPLLRGALDQRGSVRPLRHAPIVSARRTGCRRPAKSTVPSARPPLSHARPYAQRLWHLSRRPNRRSRSAPWPTPSASGSGGSAGSGSTVS